MGWDVMRLCHALSSLLRPTHGFSLLLSHMSQYMTNSCLHVPAVVGLGIKRLPDIHILVESERSRQCMNGDDDTHALEDPLGLELGNSGARRYLSAMRCDMM